MAACPDSRCRHSGRGGVAGQVSRCCMLGLAQGCGVLQLPYSKAQRTGQDRTGLVLRPCLLPALLLVSHVHNPCPAPLHQLHSSQHQHAAASPPQGARRAAMDRPHACGRPVRAALGASRVGGTRVNEAGAIGGTGLTGVYLHPRTERSCWGCCSTSPGQPRGVRGVC